MKLEVHERLALLEILPQTGSYAELKSLRKAREIISFTQDEIEFYKLVINKDKRWEWSAAQNSQRVLDAPIEEYIVDTVRKSLSTLEEKHAMTDMYVSLYEKFIIDYRTTEK